MNISLKRHTEKQLIQKNEPQIPKDLIDDIMEYMCFNDDKQVCRECGEIEIPNPPECFWCELCRKYYHKGCYTEYFREYHVMDDVFYQHICGNHILIGDEIDDALPNIQEKILINNRGYIKTKKTDMVVFNPPTEINKDCERHMRYYKMPKRLYWCAFHTEFKCGFCIEGCFRKHITPDPFMTETDFHDYGTYL